MMKFLSLFCYHQVNVGNRKEIKFVGLLNQIPDMLQLKDKNVTVKLRVLFSFITFSVIFSTVDAIFQNE